MTWWNPIKLGGLRARLARSLRRACLPFWAVYQTDLGTLIRSWVLRAWLVLTALVALIALLDRADPQAVAARPGAGILAGFLHPVSAPASGVAIVCELLRVYVFLWVSFVLVLTAGTIPSELGVVADSVLSRGISRWQYFLAKWTARLTAVLGVYFVVMVPTALVTWLGASPSAAAGDPEFVRPVAWAQAHETAGVGTELVSLGGAGWGLVRVGALLAFVATWGVATSATFTNSLVSVAVGWITLYGTGFVLATLDIRFLSPMRLLRELPELVAGSYVNGTELKFAGGWMLGACAAALVSGTLFARRDI